MKNYSLLIRLVVCCAFVLMHSPSYAQERTSATPTRTPVRTPTATATPSASVGRTLTAEQLDAIVKPTLAQCQQINGRERVDSSLIIPTRNARAFPNATIAKTLHGIWRGQIFGDNKEVHVDYFWIMDTVRNEGLIIAQRSGKESTADLKPVANAPKITYLMCAHEGYLPATDTAQIHEFVKVSDGIEDAQRVLQKATGLKFRKAQPTLSDLWQEIVASGYFKKMPAVAFAGGLFKPIQITSVPSQIGPAQVSLKWNAEYYGGGTTSLKFTPGEPIKGVEYTQFVGTTAGSGNYLVASPGNGKLWKVEALSGHTYDLAFDSVVLGPLR
jgi:hypothetical protein